MEIQPIVIGTAGHIDHGKSTLVRALTGIDPDRLKEERERGMTIDLGFAPLELDDGRLVGIVDVPGHERFVRNMVAGASGIDLVILVVAADDGMMPQTREHLQIMDLLGVRQGMIALTKIDMVDSELVDLAEEDVRDGVRDTFLADAPLFRVSPVSSEGLDELRGALLRMVAEAEPSAPEGIFRMPVQRVFSKQGFGTIVTGIPVSGSADIGDSLEVLPSGVRGKVRGLNAYQHKAEHIRCGHSSAINFSDVDRGAVRRGDVVATPNYFSPRRMVAARLTALPDLSRSITNRMPVRLHTGTADPPGEVILLDAEEIGPGQSGLVQVRLAAPLVCAPGDRFVLRLASPVVTLGGGTILEESRYRLKRYKGFVLDELGRQEESLDSPVRLLESVLARRGVEAASAKDLSVAIKRPRGDVRELVAELEAEGRLRAIRADHWIHADAFDAALARLRAALDGWFAANPHRLQVEVLRLRRDVDLEPSFMNLLLEEEEKRGTLERLAGGRVRLVGREASLEPAFAALCEKVASRFETARFQPPSLTELEGPGAGEKEVARALERLVDQERVVRVTGELYLSASAFEDARSAVVENCERHGHLEIPELRDRLGTTRKFLIPLLEHFDGSGLTLRQGAHRVLRKR